MIYESMTCVDERQTSRWMKTALRLGAEIVIPFTHEVSFRLRKDT